MRKILILVGKIEIIVATLCLSFVVFMIIVQVGLNNLFNSAIIWEQEAGRYALIWLTFIGASVGVKQMRHVTIISFVGYLPIKYRFLMNTRDKTKSSKGINKKSEHKEYNHNKELRNIYLQVKTISQ